MAETTVKVSFDIPAAVARLRVAANKALTITGNQALQDTTKHVPMDQGTLQNSGITFMSVEDMEVMLRWDEPYAQYLFHGEVMYGNPTNRTYGPKKLKFTEALARMEWTKYAAEVYGKDWQAIFQAALKRGVR